MAPHARAAQAATIATARPLPLRVEFRSADAGSVAALQHLLEGLGLDRFEVAPRRGSSRGLLLGSRGAVPERAGQRRWTIRGLRGVLRGTHAGLDLAIVAAAPGQACVPTLTPALDLAARRPGGRLHIVAGQPDRAAGRALQRAARRAGVETITRDDLAGTLALLVERPEDFDVIVVAGEDAEALAATAGSLAGTRAMVPRSTVRGDRLLVGAQEATPSALVLATASLLEGLGFREAPQRLQDAWLCALEDGFEHAGLAHVAPYTQRCDDAGFLAAVTERIGCSPRRLKATAGRLAAGGRARLRLV